MAVTTGRRSFLQRAAGVVGGVVVAATVGKSEKMEQPPDPIDSYEYRGYKITNTSWDRQEGFHTFVLNGVPVEPRPIRFLDVSRLSNEPKRCAYFVPYLCYEIPLCGTKDENTKAMQECKAKMEWAINKVMDSTQRWKTSEEWNWFLEPGQTLNSKRVPEWDEAARDAARLAKYMKRLRQL